VSQSPRVKQYQRQPRSTFLALHFSNQLGQFDVQQRTYVKYNHNSIDQLSKMGQDQRAASADVVTKHCPNNGALLCGDTLYGGGIFSR
jgi:hypothetical protein